MNSKLSAYESYYRNTDLTDYKRVFERNNEKELEVLLCVQRLRDWVAKPQIRVLDIGCGLGAFTCHLLDALYRPLADSVVKPRVICDLVDINSTAFDLFAARTTSLKHCIATVGERIKLPWQNVARDKIPLHYDLVIANHTFYGCICDSALAQSIINLLTPDGLALVALVSRKSDLIQMRREGEIQNNCAEDFELAFASVFGNFTRIIYDSKFRFDLGEPEYLDWFFASGDCSLAERNRLIQKYAQADAESPYIANRAMIHILEAQNSSPTRSP